MLPWWFLEISLKSPGQRIHSLRFKRTDEEHRGMNDSLVAYESRQSKKCLRDSGNIEQIALGKVVEEILPTAMCAPRLVIFGGWQRRGWDQRLQRRIGN